MIYDVKSMSDVPLNIMLTSAGRHVVLLEEFRRAMGDLGIAGRIIAADSNRRFPAAQAADSAVVTPDPSKTGYAPFLLEAVERNGIGLLVPLGDADLPPLAGLREQLADRGCMVMARSPQAILACQDAARFREALAAAGVPVCRRVHLPEFRRQPFYPCFIRHLDGSTSAVVAEIADDAALANHLDVYGEDVILQDFPGGREYEVDAYLAASGQLAAIVPRQRLVVRRDETEDAVTLRDDELVETVRRVVDAIPGLVGPLCCRCVRPDAGPPRVLRLLPRFVSGVALSIAAGADMPRYCLQDATGRNVDAPAELREHLAMVSYRADTFRELDDASILSASDTPVFK
jgi:carbamoyl-phosphate synthase large subunit